jgi:hypothetical protein
MCRVTAGCLRTAVDRIARMLPTMVAVYRLVLRSSFFVLRSSFFVLRSSFFVAISSPTRPLVARSAPGCYKPAVIAVVAKPGDPGGINPHAGIRPIPHQNAGGQFCELRAAENPVLATCLRESMTASQMEPHHHSVRVWRRHIPSRLEQPYSVWP